jgi:hypothetical protein
VGIETLAIGSLIASAAGAGVSAIGAKTTADANAASYNYKAAVANNNAILAQRNADQATQAGQVGAQVQGLKTKTLVANQLVTQASNGLDVGSGTNVAVRQSAEDLGHLDTLTILSNAAKNAQGFKAQGMNFQAESGLNKAAAENAETAGGFGIATSLLGGASSFADKWAGYSQKGVF